MKTYIGIAVALSLVACEPVPQDSTAIEQRAQETNQQRMLRNSPPPQLAQSLERANLIKRLNRVNAQNMSGYIYLLTQAGTVVAFYPVNGKVTSLNSYLSGDVRPAYFGSTCTEEQKRQHQSACGTNGAGWEMVESPDYDGAYGKNSDGVFFFTADTDTYVEWHGDYLFSDAPLKLSQAPVLIRQVPEAHP